MGKHLLLNAVHQLWQRKLYTLISIISLTIGLSIFSLLFLYVKSELSFEHGWKDAGQIHRLVWESKNIPGMPDRETDYVPYAILPTLDSFLLGDIDKAARQFSTHLNLHVDEQQVGMNVSIVEPEFLDIFQFEEVEGDLDKLIQGPGFTAVSERFATEVLGPDPIGKRIQFDYGDVSTELEVVAVYRTPTHTELNYVLHVLVLMDDRLGPLFPGSLGLQEISSHLWVKTGKATDVNELNKKLEQYASLYGEEQYSVPADMLDSEHFRLWFQALTDMRFNRLANSTGSGGGDFQRVAVFSIVGLLVLLVGASNCVSVSLAIVIDRRKEIGIRKANGALRSDIVWQYLLEALLLATLALLLSLVLMELLFPVFRAYMNISQLPDPGIKEFFQVALIALGTGLLCGFYPAAVLSSVRPVNVLKSGGVIVAASGMKLRNLLLFFQFSFVLVLMIGSLSLYAQLKVLSNQPLGFNAHNLYRLAFLSFQEPENPSALLTELSKISGVEKVSFSSADPNWDDPRYNIFDMVSELEKVNSIQAQWVHVHDNQLDVMDVPLLAGRLFEEGRDLLMQPVDLDSGSIQSPLASAVLNRQAAKAFGFTSPETAIGKLVYLRFNNGNGAHIDAPLQVIGVIEDNRYQSLRELPRPELYSLSEGSGYYLMLRYDDAVADTIQTSVEQVWTEVTGLSYFIGSFMDDVVAVAYDHERREGTLLLLMCALSLLLSCIGLFGLVSFSTIRKVKEVGVRKVLGADVLSLTSLFLWRFSKPILLANVIAWPVAIYFVLQWMESFPWQMEKAWLLPICMASALLVLMIAWITVVGLAWKAASQKPVLALRYE